MNGLTRKQWAVIALLLALAVLPVFFGGGKKTRSKRDAQPIAEAPVDRSSVELIAEADAALIRMSEIVNRPPAPKVDDVLKTSNFLEPVPLDVPQLKEAPTETLPPKELVEAEPELIPTPYPTRTDPSEPTEVSEKSRADLERQQKDFVRREAELVSENTRLRAEQLKLTREIQRFEEGTKDSAKLSKQVRELEDKLGELSKKNADQTKSVSATKQEKLEIDRRLAEEAKLRRSLEEQLETAIKRKEEQAKENDRLKRVVGDFEKRIKLLEEQRLAESEEKEKVLMKQVSSLRKELAAVQGSTDEIKKKLKTAETEANSTKKQSEETQKDLISKQQAIDDLTLKLADAERKNEESRNLQQELAVARSALLLAEERVNALMTTPKSSAYSGNSSYQQPQYPQQQAARPLTVTPSDFMTVEVAVPKAVLRARPGEEHSIVMEIQQGSRLLVEAREGDWMRVITPKGQRAYLRSDLVIELDAAGRPRYAPVPQRQMAPPTTSTPAAPANPDPLSELLGKQQLKPIEGEKAGNNDDEERKAFETLKQGVGPKAP